MGEALKKFRRDIQAMYILSPDEHIKKADLFFAQIEKIFAKYSVQCPDWVCVVSFYSALHYVSAALLKNHSIQEKNHVERNYKVSLHLREIYIEYFELYNNGKNARYDKIKNSPEVSDAEYAITFCLPKIREYVLSSF